MCGVLLVRGLVLRIVSPRFVSPLVLPRFVCCAPWHTLAYAARCTKHKDTRADCCRHSFRTPICCLNSLLFSCTLLYSLVFSLSCHPPITGDSGGSAGACGGGGGVATCAGGERIGLSDSAGLADEHALCRLTPLFAL